MFFSQQLGILLTQWVGRRIELYDEQALLQSSILLLTIEGHMNSFISTSACYNCSNYASLGPFLLNFHLLSKVVYKGGGAKSKQAAHIDLQLF